MKTQVPELTEAEASAQVTKWMGWIPKYFLPFSLTCGAVGIMYIIIEHFTK